MGLTFGWMVISVLAVLFPVILLVIVGAEKTLPRGWQQDRG